MSAPRGRHRPRPAPALVAVVLWLACFATAALVLSGMGFAITRSPIHETVNRWDVSVTRWFAAHASPARDLISRVGSDLGMTAVIVGVAGVVVAFLWVRDRRRDAGFLMAAVSLEASVAVLVSFVVDRPRPTLIRLDAVPPTRSFPSGHTAASIALYVGMAIVLTPRVRGVTLRVVLWIFAIALPVFVGISRVYRGMHHATDVLGSLVLGCLALWFAWLVVTVTASAWRVRQAPEPVQAPVGSLLQEVSP